MRLWHIELLPVLPKQQLAGQLMECVTIALRIHRDGRINNILINRMRDYPIEHFKAYCNAVIAEIERRGYNVSGITKRKLIEYLGDLDAEQTEIFPEWHNGRYLRQCLYNLQEKYDCGGIPQEEWEIIENRFKDVFT